MKALLIPVLMLLVGLGAGIGAGMMFASETAETDPEATDGDEASADDSAESAESEAGTETEFARLNNQFIVPVVTGDSVTALVVLSVTLEVDLGGSPAVFSQEPRLRDSFLRVLFDHANVGGFDAGFTQAGTLAILRKALLESARKTLGKIVRDVLIVDIVRQEV